ncbi:MAG: hypothetical protein V5783_03710 [Pontiella sp.]
MKKRYFALISTMAAMVVTQTATAQFFTNNLQDEASVTNLFNASLGTEGAWGFSTNNVITVLNPTNTTLTILRTNLTAGASTLTTSTNDTGDARSYLATKFGGYSTNSWKAHISVESPTAGDPAQNFIFIGVGGGVTGDSGNEVFVRWQHGNSASFAVPRIYLNGSVKASWPSGISSPGTDLFITHNVDTGIITFEFDHWANDGTRSNGIDITLSYDMSAVDFSSDTEARLYFSAQSTVTFSDFWIEEYIPTTPTILLNLYAWPDSPDIITVRWDEELLSSEGYNVYRSVESEDNYTQIASGVMDTSYTDSDVTNGVSYYYKAAGANAFGEGTLSASGYAIPTPYLIIGSEATDVTKSKYELFDGDTSTFYGLDASGNAGLDYGDGNEQQLVKIRYYLRNDSWGNYDGGLRALIRSAGCMFQGANTENFSDAVTLYTLTTNNTVMGEWNEFAITDPTAFRYIRYQTGGSFNKINTMAELDFVKTSDFTSNKTPKYWLDAYYDVAAEFSSNYELADLADTDGDGLLTWEEYVAGTIPTDATSVLEVNSFVNTTNGLVISWQSVEGKSYSIVTNTDLIFGDSGIAASNITGLENETSYTTTVSGASSVFYEIGVE